MFALATVLATTFELLPERVDFVSFVLSAAGLGAIVGAFVGWRGDRTRKERAIYVEDFSLAFAVIAVVVFVIGALVEAVS